MLGKILHVSPNRTNLFAFIYKHAQSSSIIMGLYHLNGAVQVDPKSSMELGYTFFDSENLG